MREEKRNRIIAAIVVNAVLFVFIIVGVLIAQIVEISVLNHRKKMLDAELQALYEEYDNQSDLLEDFERRGKVYETVMMWLQMGIYSREEIFEKLGLPDPDVVQEDPEVKEDTAAILAIVVE